MVGPADEIVRDDGVTAARRRAVDLVDRPDAAPVEFPWASPSQLFPLSPFVQRP